MLSRVLPTTLLEIFRQIILNYEVITKSFTVPDDLEKLFKA